MIFCSICKGQTRKSNKARMLKQVTYHMQDSKYQVTYRNSGSYSQCTTLQENE